MNTVWSNAIYHSFAPTHSLQEAHCGSTIYHTQLRISTQQMTACSLISHSAMQYTDKLLQLSYHCSLTLKVLVATIDALGHFETG